MQLIVRDEGGVLVPMFANNIHALSDKLSHDEDVSASWAFDGGKASERWWFG